MSDQSQAQMPAGIGNAYTFQVFNTMSFSIVAGMPIILFFKHLAASATILGIVIALPPLLNILQIPAASLVEKVGYRTFVLRGWAVRCFIILGLALVAFLPDKIDRTTRIALMLFLLFTYNASRGFSVCGWFPWMTQLIPESLRGRYVSRDQLSGSLALLGTMIGTALFVKHADGLSTFGWIFVVGFLAGLVSLWFLRRMPDAPVPEQDRARGPIPWKAIVLHPPFYRLLLFNIVILIALAGSGVCWVPLLRDVHGFEDWHFLTMMALNSAGVALTLWGFGALADRVGSKPLLGVSGIILVGHWLLWSSVATGVIAPTVWIIIIIQLTAAVSTGLLGLANTRLLMAVVPEMGRSHFFALFSVITSLIAGIFPVLWGLLIDSLAGWKIHWGIIEWNQFSVCYALIILTYFISQTFWASLIESKAMPTDVFLHELLVKTPSRALTRIIMRRPFV